MNATPNPPVPSPLVSKDQVIAEIEANVPTIVAAVKSDAKLPRWGKALLLAGAGVAIAFADPTAFGMAAGVALLGAGVAEWAQG